MGRANLREGADFIGAVETCYARTASTTRWAKDVAGAVGGLFASKPVVGMHALTHAPDCGSGDFLFIVRPRSLVSYAPERLFSIGADAFRLFHYPPRLVTVQSELARQLAPDARHGIEDIRTQGGFEDGIGFVLHPEPGVVLVVYVCVEHPVTLARRERERLMQVALHIESAFRWRQRRGAVRAVVTQDGKILEGDPRGSRPARIAARARDERNLGLWTALVSGEVSVVATMRGTRRVYEIVENAMPSRRLRALTKLEVDVLSLAVRGMTAKLCGYALGVSPATVSTALATAATKIGATSRLELLRVAALLARDPRSEATAQTLTAAEREIADLLALGLSNSAIAERRGTSVRTIANQVAAILQKSGASSRRALVTSVR